MKADRRQQIKEGLRQHRGAVADLTRRTKSLKTNGYTRVYVDQVLKGKYNNLEVLGLAAIVLAEYEYAYAEAQARINQPELFIEENVTATA
jgi:hypothetical protein